MTMKTLPEIVGENIRARREAAGMSKYELNQIVRGRNSRDCALVHFWETGVNAPSAHYLCVLADVFKCSVDELLGRV